MPDDKYADDEPGDELDPTAVEFQEDDPAGLPDDQGDAGAETTDAPDPNYGSDAPDPADLGPDPEKAP